MTSDCTARLPLTVRLIFVVRATLKDVKLDLRVNSIYLLLCLKPNWTMVVALSNCHLDSGFLIQLSCYSIHSCLSWINVEYFGKYSKKKRILNINAFYSLFRFDKKKCNLLENIPSNFFSSLQMTSTQIISRKLTTVIWFLHVLKHQMTNQVTLHQSVTFPYLEGFIWNSRESIIRGHVLFENYLRPWSCFDLSAVFALNAGPLARGQ